MGNPWKIDVLASRTFENIISCRLQRDPGYRPQNLCVWVGSRSSDPHAVLSFRPSESSSENVSQLVEKNRCLQDQNSRLCKELSESTGQAALMFEKILMVSPGTRTAQG